MNAETGFPTDVGEFVMALQWGRVLMNAETRHSAMRPYESGACFNGAAFS